MTRTQGTRRRSAATAVLVVAVMIADLMALAPLARAADFPYACDAEHDGDEWRAPDSGIWWRCRLIMVPGETGWEPKWEWVPIVKQGFSGDFVVYAWAKKALVVESAHADGDGGGASVARGIAFKSAQRFERPPGAFANRVKLVKWSERDNSWITCRNTGWEFSTQATSAFKLTVFYGIDPPCGDGYYGAESASFFSANGRWSGGWVWSGYCKMFSGMKVGRSEPSGVFDVPPAFEPSNDGPSPSDPEGATVQAPEVGMTIELSYE